MTIEPKQDRLAVALMLLVALLQGLGLLLLHQAIELKFWPHQSPQWLFCFYSVVVSAPTLLLLAVQSGRERQAALWIIPSALILGVLGFYIGSQATPLDYIRFESLLFAFVLTLGVACFKVLMYLQCYSQQQPYTYSRLFAFSWRNFLTLALALLFTLCVWGLLMLWAELFKAIDVHFFYDLFTERWFVYPALALANGFGVVIFRRLSHVIDTITRLLQALMKFLLVLLCLVSLLFLAALPITGLEPLWDSGGSFLILWMQALLLFFVNSVYQDEPDARPYGIFLHRFICFAIALLPIYSAISLYGLSLRIDQYGWSLLRLWAALIWLLLSLFSLGYLVGIIRLRDNWLHALSWVNVRLGLVVLAVMILVNTPVLDFRKITVASQLARLQAGQVTAEEFDVNYFRRNLAGPGYRAMQQLALQQPSLATRIKLAYSKHSPESDAQLAQTLVAQLSVQIPGAPGSSQPVPAALAKAIVDQLASSRWHMQHTVDYHLFLLDVDADGTDEYLLVKQQAQLANVSLYYRESDRWLHKSLISDSNKLSAETIVQALANGRFQWVTPRWPELHVDEKIYQVR